MVATRHTPLTFRWRLYDCAADIMLAGQYLRMSRMVMLPVRNADDPAAAVLGAGFRDTSSCRTTWPARICSFDSAVMYFFQPGHQLACQRQIRPRNDLGLLSYRALKPQFSQLCFVIVDLLGIVRNGTDVTNRCSTGIILIDDRTRETHTLNISSGRDLVAMSKNSGGREFASFHQSRVISDKV
jgi:hypothetical protein